MVGRSWGRGEGTHLLALWSPGFFIPVEVLGLLCQELRLSSPGRPSSGAYGDAALTAQPLLHPRSRLLSLAQAERVCVSLAQRGQGADGQGWQRAGSSTEEAERVRWKGKGLMAGRGRMGRGSGPEPLPSPTFSPWTSSSPPPPRAQNSWGSERVQGLEPPGLEAPLVWRDETERAQGRDCQGGCGRCGEDPARKDGDRAWVGGGMEGGRLRT